MRFAGIMVVALTCAVVALTCASAYAQTVNEPAAFEVASIKPSPPRVPGQGMMMGSRGGPGTDDPGMYRCSNCNLQMLIVQAYDLKFYQLIAPGLPNDARFEVTAKVPEGTTKEQFRLMLQSLLAERFKLAVHREKKEMQVFDLVIAKGGPKLIEHKAEAAKEEDAAPSPPVGGRGGRGPNVDKDGYPVIPKNCKGCIMVVGGGKARMQMTDAPIKDLADLVGDQLEKPVFDATGLKGKYDMSVTFQMSFGTPARGGGASAGVGDRPLDSADGDTGVTLASALGPQLGLKLESKKGQVDMLVVDHVDKVPTEN